MKRVKSRLPFELSECDRPAWGLSVEEAADGCGDGDTGEAEATGLLSAAFVTVSVYELERPLDIEACMTV